MSSSSSSSSSSTDVDVMELVASIREYARAMCEGAPILIRHGPGTREFREAAGRSGEAWRRVEEVVGRFGADVG